METPQNSSTWEAETKASIVPSHPWLYTEWVQPAGLKRVKGPRVKVITTFRCPVACPQDYLRRDSQILNSIGLSCWPGFLLSK
ncbi:mCG142590, isoform CRA_b [Mus musculus]|nr:mCG142590, isoform CRA_b [Mus musculus]